MDRYKKSPHLNQRSKFCGALNEPGCCSYLVSMRKRRDVHPIDLEDRLTVTIERTAEVLDVGRSTVYQLLRSGKLRGVKFGRAHRVVVQSIHDLVAKSSS
jgi:excisionase family DNA binding protein